MSAADFFCVRSLRVFGPHETVSGADRNVVEAYIDVAAVRQPIHGTNALKGR